MKCSRLGCENEGTWFVVLLLRSSAAAMPLRFYLGPEIKVCDSCKEGMTPKDFIADDGWTKLEEVAKLATRQMMRRECTDVGFTKENFHAKVHP